MANKTLGQFIAALRKAKGFTQQEVADRLNVSNKAVSRWERDEAAPDISLLPAIAEMFDVTCDELLKGERILNANSQDKNKPKVERQLKNCINRTLYNFKNRMFVAIALSTLGLICMFGISYAAYLPIAGFAVLLSFVVGAISNVIIGINKLKLSVNSELIADSEESIKSEVDKTLWELSFASLFYTFSVVLFSLPLILYSNSYVQSVLSLKSYFENYFLILLVLDSVFYYISKNIYKNMVTGSKFDFKIKFPKNNMEKMNVIQLILIIVASVLFVIAPYFDTYTSSTVYLSISIVALALLLSVVVCFVVFLIKCKETRKLILIKGLQNVFLIIPSLCLINFHSSVWTTLDVNYTVSTIFERYDYWQSEYLYYSIFISIFIFVLFGIIEKVLSNSTK